MVVFLTAHLSEPLDLFDKVAKQWYLVFSLKILIYRQTGRRKNEWRTRKDEKQAKGDYCY